MMVEAEATRVLAGPSGRAAVGVGTGLAVRREDICFYNVAADRLRIEVTVQNRSDTPSNPEPMLLQFAAFGAFLPWTPLQLLQVPRIRPGGSRLVSTEVVVFEDGTLVAKDGGAFSEDRERYRAALRTIQDDDQLKTMSAWQVVARKVRDQLAENRVERMRAQREAARKAQEQASENRVQRLRPWNAIQAEVEELFDLEPEEKPRVDLHQGRSVHWVGNINVLMNGVDVERHEARAFRIYPEKINRSWFFLGGSIRDTTSFEIRAPGEGWSVKLYNKSTFPNGRSDGFIWPIFISGLESEHYSGELIKPGEWGSLGFRPRVVVEICPPRDATKGTLAIQVLQKSPCSEEVRKAVVEFDFSKSAVGPGCHTVGGS
ncbi:MAG: hypothetical protein VCD34_03330 [Planctomycetota bacterium]